MKGETNTESPSPDTTAASTPDIVSVLDQPSDASAEAEGGVSGSSNPNQPVPLDAEFTKDSGNFLGKINNLVTSDASNIAAGADICMLGECEFGGAHFLYRCAQHDIVQ